MTRYAVALWLLLSADHVAGHVPAVDGDWWLPLVHVAMLGAGVLVGALALRQHARWVEAATAALVSVDGRLAALERHARHQATVLDALQATVRVRPCLLDQAGISVLPAPRDWPPLGIRPPEEEAGHHG